MRLYPAIDLTWSSPLAADLEDRLLADIDGLGATAVDERADGLRIFFVSPVDRAAALARLPAHAGVRCAPVDVPDEDWAARSQAALQPVTVGTITVAPPWTVTPALRVASPHLIVIQPSMGFGTGHHASTRLCLDWLQRTPLAGAGVLDVGTGSGVLAIAASQLGASTVAAIDVDPDALASARENLELNTRHTGGGLQPAAGPIALHQLDLAGASIALGRRFDVILANLTGGLLCRDAASFGRLAAPGARLITSGFQTHEVREVVGALSEAGWTPDGQTEDQDWVGIRFSGS